MGVKGKLIASMEVKCGGHLIHDLLHTNTHQAAIVSPTINRLEVHEGEMGKVGTIINMKYNEDRQEKSVMYEIEEIDRYKKSISRKVIGGDLLDFYSSFTIISSCEQQWITWTFEYEKKLEDNQEPINFLGFILNATKDIEGHFLKK
ncbi:kirola-like [Solanum pennellii]|uniref:Kirola-like n=1 Tax=Solanum pennellii TaxID=28526 RepID=A0ABM1HK62_SOLPN|nr:kirola-like [Solanum pennellii]